MASLVVEGDRVVVRLSRTERVLGAALSDPSAPLSAVASVRVERPTR
jgi:hypothetical protein